MKKIGILTFHYSCNYGAVLQAMALQDYINSIGYEASIIDYRNREIDGEYKVLPKHRTHNLRYRMTFLMLLLMRYVRIKNFWKFINKNLDLKPVSFIDKCDCIVIGSDQVWNPTLTAGHDEYYWGNKFKNKKIISYAASMNKSEISDEQKAQISRSFANFSAITVRETSLKNLLSPLTSTNIDVVLDPTALPSYEYWTSKAKKLSDDNYVLAYPLKDGEMVMRCANKIAKELGLKLTIIKGGPRWHPFNNIQNTAGPQEFLSLFYNAKFVVTSSFHGTMFSLIYKKNFYTVATSKENSVRTASLLNMIDLSDRLISSDKLINVKSTVSYDKTYRLFLSCQEESRNLLKRYLND